MEDTFNALRPHERLSALYRMGRRAYGPYKLQIVLLTLLGFLSGILESVGVTTFVPLLSFEIGQGNNVTDTITNFIRGIFSFAHVPFLPKYLLLFIVLLFVGKATVGILLDYIRISINAHYESVTRNKLFTAQLRSSWPHLLRQRLGHLETLILVDIPMSKDLLGRLTVSITYVTNLAMYLIVVFNVSAMVTILTTLIGFLFVFLFQPISRRIRKQASARSHLQHEMTHHVTEHLSGMKTVKTLSGEESAIKRSSVFFDNLRVYDISIAMLRTIAVAIVPPFAIIYVAIVFGLAFRFHLVAVAALPTLVYLIYRIFSYVQQLQDSMQVINGYIPYLRNVLRYEDQAHDSAEVAEGGGAFSFRNSLDFESVRFAYQGGTDVLHDVTFSIPRGTITGIIGPSGAGKTTTVDLILRLLEPTSGKITLDGFDIRSVDLTDWRSSVAYVSQDFFLMHDTIRNNIRFYDESITDEMVWEAVRMAHIDGFIKERPEGLDTQVGERGIQLSAGQRQRLTIARALVRKPQVLILDEATSALDAESESHIQRVLSELKGKMTIIVIAHRLSTILHSDSLIVIENGRVVEEGVPQKLLQDKNSYFYKVSTITA